MAHQFLVHAEGMNLVNDEINTIKETAQACLSSYKTVSRKI
jgi:hypothetical protein